MGSFIKHFSVKNWIFVGIIFIFTFIQVAFTMIIVLNVGELTGAVTTKNYDDILRYGFLMFLAAVLLAIASIAIQIFASKTASDIVTKKRIEIYKKVNEFALCDLNKFSTESLITRTTNDLTNVHLALLTGLRTIFIAPITIVWSIILLVRNASAGLTIGASIWLFLLVAVIVILIIMVMPKFKIVQRLTDALNIASRENLTGVRVVRAFNAEEYQENKFDKVNIEFTKAQIFTGRVIAFFSPFVILVMMGLTATILWITAYNTNGLKYDEAMATFQSANSFVMLSTQIVMSFVLLITLIILLPRANVSAGRIEEIMKFAPSIKDPENPKEFVEKGTIEFRNVGFMYPGNDKESVSEISFKVKQGETIAFIGATGSGKTTVINMIPRLTDATSGEVLVDGVNVKDVKQEDLRNIIGYTPQRGYLFSGNVKDNILFFDPNQSLQRAIEAAKIAEADEFVSKKSDQYNSLVAQGGTNFSGGQKQRLCIARSVAKKPEILIFDDSFSALDYKTDRKVRENIKNGLPGTTRVIIAQRVGTIMDADQIVVLDKGKIVGLGKHYDLVRNCPVYQEIALSQLSKKELGL